MVRTAVAAELVAVERTAVVEERTGSAVVAVERTVVVVVEDNPVVAEVAAVVRTGSAVVAVERTAVVLAQLDSAGDTGHGCFA